MGANTPQGGSKPNQPNASAFWSNGWWVLAVVAILMVAAAIRLIVPVVNSIRSRETQDRNFQAAEFDTSFSLVPQDQVFKSEAARDSTPALTNPKVVPGTDVLDINEEMHGKFLVTGDRVIGLSVNGNSRAYPINILTWHEVINDELGGIPVAVTYYPLSDSTAVFDRRVSGNTLEFGASGYIYNSNQLLYDRHPGGEGESLWSQLQMKAICGPAAREGRTLELMDSVLTQWSDWLALHPDTDVVSLETGYGKEYGSNPFLTYFGNGLPIKPVVPGPQAEGILPMARIVAILVGESDWAVYLYDHGIPEEALTEPAQWNEGGVDFTRLPYTQSMGPPTLRLGDGTGGSIKAVYSFWFVWNAMYPDAPLPVDVSGKR